MLDHFQKEATGTFKDHTSLNAHQARLLNWGIGLGGEAGEVEELLKHHVFAEEVLNKMELAKELGDVLWYISAIAETTDIQMTDVAELNLAKLNHRYHKGKYTDDGAQLRHERENIFTDTPIYKVLSARISKTIAPMNVIFIGPDGSGKTTLSKRVAEQMGFTYHKCDYKQDNKTQLAKELLTSQIDVVYDRFYWPDDALYCNVKNIEMPDSYWQEYEEIISLLQNLNTLYIYVGCAKQALILRSSGWKDDYVNVGELDAIIKCYRNWLNYVDKLHISTCCIDTTGVGVDTPEFNLLVEGCCNAIKTGQEVYARKAKE